MQALDGELSAAGRVELDGHLARCADCRAEWERLQTLERWLHAAPMARPPAGFFGRAMARLDRRRRVRRTALGALALTAGGGAMAVLLVPTALWKLPSLFSILRPFLAAGDLLLDRLLASAVPLLNSLCLTFAALLYPLLLLALVSLALALLSGLLWWGMLRRMAVIG